MYLSATHEQQRQFLEEMADSYSFIGDMRIAFLYRFDPINKDKINHTLARDITSWNKTPEQKDQKLQDELKKICDVLEKDGCNLGDRKPGRKPKGETPWELSFKWLWVTKYREWLEQQSIPISEEQVQKNAVCQFLEDVENRFKHIDLFRTTQPIVLKDQYIPIQVTLERKYKHEVETTWSYAESEAEFKRVYELKGSEESQRNQVDWTQAKQKLKSKPIMVLADPGMGKTTLLRMEAYLTARKEREDYQNNIKNLEEVVFPLFLRLSDIAKATNEVTAKLIDVILGLIESKYDRCFPLIKSILEDKLRTGKCLLLLDGLDEVFRENRNNLSVKLNNFICNYPCRIISTSRIVGYSGVFIEGIEEVEIVPFSQKQIDKYIEIWFKNKPEDLHNNSVLASSLIRKLQNKPQIRGLTQNPLLLSLICSLYQQQDLTLPTRRCQVYEQAVRYMLSKWGQQRNSELNDGWIDAKTELLEELAYQFSCDNQAIFTMRELRSKIDKYKRTGKASTDFDNISPSSLITEFSEQDGILQKQHKDSSDQYLFLHRTFQEYLTACYLNRSDSGIELAKNHFWNYEWHETLSLMAGMMKNPVPLLEGITNEKDDIFSTLLLLAGKCIAECDAINHELIERTIGRIFQLWCCYPRVGFIGSVVVAIGQTNSLMLDKLQQALKEAFNDQESKFEHTILDILGKIGSPQSIKILKSASDHQDFQIRSRINFAILTNEAPQTYAELKRLSQHHNETKANSRIATFNRGLADSYGTYPQAINTMISKLKHKDVDVRCQAAKDLGKTGSSDAVMPLIDALNDNDPRVRTVIAEALGNLGDIRAIEPLTSIVKNENDDDVKESSASALIKLGIIDRLDLNQQISNFLKRLAKLEPLNVVNLVLEYEIDITGDVLDLRELEEYLFSMIDYENWEVKSIAVSTLSEIGTLATLAKLIQSPEIDIYEHEIFLLARKLAVRFSKEKVDFIPVYPELLGTSFDN